MKKILGLDLGTNSIGWAVINAGENNGEILGLGSRIIPMSQDIIGKFEAGNSISQTAERTDFRSIRRLRERKLLRRERLHRLLNIINFLPQHYRECIDFIKQPGKFIDDSEPKIAYITDEEGRYSFLFQRSFYEMLKDFERSQPELIKDGKKLPYDWTLYYLRKKALFSKIEKEELAWLILNFNQKRGYYQQRGEEQEETQGKSVEFHALLVTDVKAEETKRGGEETWYSIILENGWIYRRSSRIPLFDWKNKIKEFIVTTDLNDDGSIKKDKEGKEKRSFRSPSADDWTLIKTKTEFDISNSHKTVGCYIYDILLANPKQKINGKLVRTIERKYYQKEIIAILEKQKEYHSELSDVKLFRACLKELYPNNESHRSALQNAGFTKLITDDLLFYQRPLKSKKSLINNCAFENYYYKDTVTGEKISIPVKCIPKSNLQFQEFRLWQFIHNLRIYERQKNIEGKLHVDYDVTKDFLKSLEDYEALFDWLNNRKNIKQETLFTGFFKMKKAKGGEISGFRWNYIEEKEYPCNETHSQIITLLGKCGTLPPGFPDAEAESALWHLLYSIEDKVEIEKALMTFATKFNLGQQFIATFKKFPPFKKEYGSYSEKAIKKLLPLMRMGKYWNPIQFDKNTKFRIEKIINGEFDERINSRVREKAVGLKDISCFTGLPVWLASYIVYDRHSELGQVIRWEKYEDIDNYIQKFKQHSLRNPIVEQVIIETLRVVRDIWKKYGEFDEIHIELGREMKNSAQDREMISQMNTQNEITNLRIRALLSEFANDNFIENVRPYSPSQQELLKIYEDGILKSGIEIPEDIAKIVKASQPSKSELIRYKLWLEQKYRSPYTGEVIPLGKLFTSAYQIEHVIPQSRYFDDSMSNKVICEAEVNTEKDNYLGFEFIKNNEGRIIELSHGKKVKIFRVPEYEDFIKQHYSNNRTKLKKLLLDEIPESFIERQMNDSKYISVVAKSLLSNLVRTDDEQEAISKNVIPCSGTITDYLKRDWGLTDVWNSVITPRFERLNSITGGNTFGQWMEKSGNRVFQINIPQALLKGFNKKRIDHRHHALDALVIACATRNHISYLNNEHANKKGDKIRYDLRNKLRRFEEVEVERQENGQKVRRRIKVAKEFYKPWSTFTQDAKSALETIIVSFKQNLRVINKTTNKYQCNKNGKMISEKQKKGDSWAIRKPLHKETVAGLVTLRFKKKVSFVIAIDHWEMIVDKNLKTKIKGLIGEGYDKNNIIRFFKENDNQWGGKSTSNVEIYYFDTDREGNPINTASRIAVDQSFNSSKLLSITDSGIRKILLKHLEIYNERKGELVIEHPELAFSPEGLEDMNRRIIELNDGKFHQPIIKVRVYEPRGNKFNVGNKGNKKDKYVEAAKGTNLFFAIYINEKNSRVYETIPLNIVIERLKQGLREVPEIDGNRNRLLFYLSPNDLVYVPSLKQESEFEANFEKLDCNRIYRFIDSSGTTANFVLASSSTTIFSANRNDQAKLGINYPIQNEFGIGSSQSKNQKAITGEMIKDVCIKIVVDRLGKVISFTKI